MTHNSNDVIALTAA